MQIGWVDFSERDRRTALDVIQMGAQQGTVDELGTGIISEAFSNYFFPGTSTIQTKAKYFFLVPYAVQETIRQKSVTNVKDALRVLDELEEKTCKSLVDKCGSVPGIIGQDNIRQGKWVKRSPSSIYWNGLRTLGFFNAPFGFNPSISEYFRAELKQRAHLKDSSDDLLGDDIDRDDRDAGHGLYHEYWTIPYIKDWKNHLDIKLTRDEASTFAEKIHTHKHGTLLEFLLDEKQDLNYTNFLDMAEHLKGEVAQPLGSMMQMALDFDGLFYLGTILFNLELSDDQNEKALEEWEIYRPKASTMAGHVNLDAIYSSLGIRNRNSYVFLKNLRECLIENSDESIARARMYIVRQSEALKRGNSKLKRKNEFDNQHWFGGGHLDYRFNNAMTILNDIKEGMGDA